MELVLASHNAGKLAEMQALLAPLAVRLVPQPALGVAPAPEPYPTFIENALAKARHAAAASGRAAIADDSGLSVAALEGAPGVRSARYAASFAREPDDASNNLCLLEQLGGCADRRARFICALVALRRADDPEPLVAMGRWEGEILHAPRGQGGFGYDPLLYIPSLGATVAELDPALKNRHSHRGQAMAAMLAQMRAVWSLG